MTRAVIVDAANSAGFHGERGPAEGCWHAMIRAALADRLEELPDPFDAERRILRSRDTPAARKRDAPRPAPERVVSRPSR